MQHSTLPATMCCPPVWQSAVIGKHLGSLSIMGYIETSRRPPQVTTVQLLSMPEWNPPCWCVAQPWWVTYERCQNYNCHLNILKSDLISGANQHHHQWSRLILNIHNIELGPFITQSLARVGGWWVVWSDHWMLTGVHQCGEKSWWHEINCHWCVTGGSLI